MLLMRPVKKTFTTQKSARPRSYANGEHRAGGMLP